MQARGLLAATVALLLLAGGVWFSNREEAKKKDQPAADAPPKLLSIPVAEISEVRIERGAEKIVLLRAEDGAFRITEPAAVPADIEAASAYYLQFSVLDAERVVDAKPADLAQFGLAPPRITVTAVRKKGTPVKILLGETSPTGASTFAKLESESRVVTLQQTIAVGFEKSLKDLRDKRLAPFDRGSLSHIAIAGKGGPVDLNLAKAGWRSGMFRADNAAVDDLLRNLDSAHMDPLAVDQTLEAAAKAWPSAASIATVRLTDSTGTRQLEVRRAKDDVYVKSSAIEGVHKGTVELADAIAKPAAQYRNSRIFDFGFDDPTKVEVKDGASTRVLTQADGKWTEGGKALDSVGAQSLVDKLRDLKAASFATAARGAADLDITVVSNAGQRTEHVLVSKDGTAFVARRDGEPEYYVLDAKAVSELRQAAQDVKQAVAPPPAATKK